MCAHIGQNRDIYPPSIFRLHFWLVPLPLLRRLTMGAAIEKNFFWFLFFWFSLVISEVWIEIIFFEFYTRYSYLENFFLFFQNIASTRQVFTGHSLSAFIFSRFILVWFWFRIYFISITIFDSDYNFGFCVFRFWILLVSISTCFSIVDSML